MKNKQLLAILVVAAATVVTGVIYFTHFPQIKPQPASVENIAKQMWYPSASGNK